MILCYVINVQNKFLFFLSEVAKNIISSREKEILCLIYIRIVGKTTLILINNLIYNPSVNIFPYFFLLLTKKIFFVDTNWGISPKILNPPIIELQNIVPFFKLKKLSYRYTNDLFFQVTKRLHFMKDKPVSQHKSSNKEKNIPIKTSKVSTQKDKTSQTKEKLTEDKKSESNFTQNNQTPKQDQSTSNQQENQSSLNKDEQISNEKTDQISLDKDEPTSDKEKDQTSEQNKDEQVSVDDSISSTNRENLSKLNKQVGKIAEKYSQQNELNGLLLLGNTVKFVSKTIEPLVESNNRTKLNQDAISNLESLMGDRFNGKNDKPFTWKKGKDTVEWSVERDGQKKKLVGHLIGKQKQPTKVFEAVQHKPHTQWHLVESKLTDKQLKSLAKAEKSKSKKIPEKFKSRQKQSKELSR